MGLNRNRIGVCLMGAAGYVTVYDRAELEERYAEKYPDRVLTEDWWYLDTITLDLNGIRLVMDYHDDQGIHDGVENSFWFKSEPNEDWFESDAQKRVLSVLREIKPLSTTEVWT